MQFHISNNTGLAYPMSMGLFIHFHVDVQTCQHRSDRPSQTLTDSIPPMVQHCPELCHKITSPLLSNAAVIHLHLDTPHSAPPHDVQSPKKVVSSCFHPQPSSAVVV